MQDKVILISKDVLRADYLPVYGNKYWNTPNIDELAKKGTVFRRHYSAAPSSAMAYTCMFSGLFAHELDRSKYTEVKPFTQCSTLFQILQSLGYNCHVIWDEVWMKTSYLHSKVYGDESTTFHNIKISQHIGPHKINDSEISEDIVSNTINLIAREVDNIFINYDKLFVWLHLPHVIKGRPSYGSDIDLFDEIIGEMRKRFNDESIFITADHGHMNCEKGIPVYGFHVYEGAIKIPLITPLIIDSGHEINYPTSNVQLKEIILNKKIEKREYIFSDSQYYMQENRRLAIIKDNYKYIYNKKDRTEELYDIDFDPTENVNLLSVRWYDQNRMRYYYTKEIYYYPYRDKIPIIYEELKQQKDKIWKTGKYLSKYIYMLDRIRRRGKGNITNLINRRKKINGLSNSKIRTNFYEK